MKIHSYKNQEEGIVTDEKPSLRIEIGDTVVILIDDALMGKKVLIENHPDSKIQVDVYIDGRLQ